ncbi:MAG TPA: hypothetical protein VF441_10010 [Acidimicrobiia bacterium]
MTSVLDSVSETPPEVVVDTSQTQRSRSWTALAIVVVIAPLVVAAVVLIVRGWNNLVPTDDIALTEVQVREIGRHAVLTGAYSRFHWRHPGPALFYLLAPAYWLLRSRSVALDVGALLINAASIGAIIVLAARRGGRALVAYTSVLLALFCFAVGPVMLYRPWTPHVTLLPFALVIVLLWSTTCGDAWALPVAFGVGSFVVQAHVGYVGPVVTAFVVTALLLTVQMVRPAWRPFSGRRLGVALAISAAVVAVLWALPVWQQLTGRPGNLGDLWRYVRDLRPARSYASAFGVTVRQLGVVPHQVVTAHTGVASPNLAGGLITLGALVVAAVVAWRYRLSASLRLLAIVAALMPVSALAVARVSDNVSDTTHRYLVRWIAVIGLVAWIAFGSTVIAALQTRVATVTGRVDGPRRRTGLRLAAAGAAVVLALLTIVNVRAATRIETRPVGTSASVANLSPRVEHALHTTGNGHVLVAMADGAPLDVVAGLLLQLDRRGTPVVVEPTWGWLLGPQLVRDHERVTQTVTVVGPAQTALLRRDPAWRRIASAGGFEAYVARGDHPLAPRR